MYWNKLNSLHTFLEKQIKTKQKKTKNPNLDSGLNPKIFMPDVSMSVSQNFVFGKNWFSMISVVTFRNSLPYKFVHKIYITLNIL